MLVIAIPKSASTSLLVTLESCCRKPGGQTFFPDASIPKETSVIHKYHSDIRECTSKQAQHFSSGTHIFKQHIPPTSNNLSLLRSQKKVILLRKPQGVIGGYFRARFMHNPRKEFEGLTTLSDWLDRAKEIGLTNDLEWFYNTWSVEQDNSLIINYRSVVEEPLYTVNKIQDFFGLKRSASCTLAKMRYSRNK